MTDGFRRVAMTRVRGTSRAADADRAATEEPLEIRLHGRPFATIMRTPGADRDLAAGFLWAERVLRNVDDLGAIEHCADAQRAGAPAPNVVNVMLLNGSASALEAVFADRRHVTTTASCGVCGRVTIESLRVEAPPIETRFTVPVEVLSRVPDALRNAQAVFDQTGGLHAAGLFARDGALEQAAEDIGRHNAVDKVVGRRLIAEALPIGDRLLFVSGRASFEIVQKAFLAGIPIVASVSAPSSLAIELAVETGVTLAGFVRGDGFNIYSHPERIV